MPEFKELSTAEAKGLLAQGYSLDGCYVVHVPVSDSAAELELRNASGELIARRVARANPKRDLPRSLAFTFQAVACIAITHTQNVPLGGQSPTRRFWFRVTTPRERAFYQGNRPTCTALEGRLHESMAVAVAVELGEGGRRLAHWTELVDALAAIQVHEPEGSRCDVPAQRELWDASARGGL